jgi:hypothetical protein
MLNIGVLPGLAFGADQVIVEKVATSEAGQIELQVPDDAPIGHHIMTVEVLDDQGVVTSRDVTFCKDTQGEIQWDDVCPDVIDVVEPSRLEGIFNPLLLPNYNPEQDSKNVGALVVGAFALLGATAAGSSTSTSPTNGGGDAPAQEREELEGIEAGHRRRIRRPEGPGDRSETFRWPLTDFFDRQLNLLAVEFSRFTPLLARIIQDGNYLRAMVGSLSTLLYPVAFYLGLTALGANTWQAMPTVTALMITIMVVGLLDTFAGFIAGYTFLAGTLITGRFNSRQEILGTLGVMIIWFAPALIMSSMRPLRRYIDNRSELWERITDYALSILLTGWIVQKMVAALPGLTGKQLAITGHKTELAIAAATLIAVRLLLEDLSTHAYPVRNDKIELELHAPKSWHTYSTLVIKALMYYFLAERYIGNTWELYVGLILFIIPMGLEFLEENFPKRALIYRLLPKGAVLILVMILVGSWFANFLATQITNPHSLLLACFVLLGLPSLVVSILNYFGVEHDSAWNQSGSGLVLYRVGGVVVYIALALQIMR